MKTLLCLAAFAVVLPATAEPSAPTSFGVAGVRLAMSVAEIPNGLREDCQPLKYKPTVEFCAFLSESGGVPLSVEYSVEAGRVETIYVHFPRSEHLTVWLALNARYGKEHEREPNHVRWYSGPRGIDDPIPDELTLTATPDAPPYVDGKYIKAGVEYALLEFASMAAVRERSERRAQERQRKVDELSESF